MHKAEVALLEPKQDAYHGGEHHVDVINAGQAEIGQFDLTLRGHEHVLRLEVTVHDSIGV